MANPADQAAIEDAKFKAEMARTDAKNTMTTLSEQSQLFKQSAEQTLANGMVSLAMSGNTGFSESEAPASAAAVGSSDSEAVATLKTDVAAMQEELANTPSTIQQTVEGKDGDSSTQTVENPDYTRLQAEIATAQEKLDVVGKNVTPTISNPSMLLKASGSDLLTLMNTRDMMQRDLNTYSRTQKNSALTMLENAGNYDLAAEYAAAESSYDTLSTILGFGFSVAGLFI